MENPFASVPTDDLVVVAWVMNRAIAEDNENKGRVKVHLAALAKEKVTLAAVCAVLNERECEMHCGLAPWFDDGDDLVWLPND